MAKKVGRVPIYPFKYLGDHMPFDEFVRGVESGVFTDDDGHGYFATDTTVSEILVLPSEVGSYGWAPPDWVTHVLWINA